MVSTPVKNRLFHVASPAKRREYILAWDIFMRNTLTVDWRSVVRIIPVQSPNIARHRAIYGHGNIMATTYETLRADIITAMKARDSATATILRTADAAIQRASMDLNEDIDEALVISSLRKSVKNLKDANTEFAKGGRDDLIAANDAEIAILSKYLPQLIDGEKLEALVAQALSETGAQTRKEMGKVIGALKKHPEADLIDFGSASKLIQAKLS